MAYITLTSGNTPQVQGLGHLIHLVNQLKEKVLTKHLVELDITAQQFKFMLVIKRLGNVSCDDISQMLSTDASATTRLVDRLELKSLVKRLRCPDDRRRVKLQLTSMGEELTERFDNVIANSLEELTQGMTNDEIDALEALMMKLLINNGVITE